MNVSRLLRRILYVVAGALAAIVAIVCIYVLVKYDPPPLSHQAITERVDRLNEAAAIQVPHNSLDDGKTRAHNLLLFEPVERGEMLSIEDSARYRVIYQELLQRNQKYLGRFDRNLTVLWNVGMDHTNNVQGKGIEGAHDHHDESARSNYRDMRDWIRRLNGARGFQGSFARVKYAIYAYKDLTDIILHLATAPQTKSVPYAPSAPRPTDKFELIFEDVLREFKLAQFEPVNSPAYKEHIVLALNSYDQLVLAVQDEVYAHLSPTERTLSGSWGGWQSLGASTEGVEPTRISRSSGHPTR